MKVVFRAVWRWQAQVDMPLRIPAQIESVAGGERQLQIVQNNDDGSICCLVSPDTAGTWRLNVSVLTLLPGREIPSRPAGAVEFYFVVSGNGLFSQQGVNETAKVEPGDCFVVDTGRIRWISNRSGGVERLVLLRATDGGSSYTRSSFDAIRKDPSKRLTALDRMRESFKQLTDVLCAKDYVNGGTHK